ncbi:hypothetical protein GGQ05_001669 [Salinibacter ruber]|jgi:hypothetical protein|uniref:Uncharacterized protein n=1 Tax=Salinibacter ruber TaxID=146919 RepID=A0A9X2Q5T4_9BACT|nr:hypothetical protein [Salinibacter ruber]MCS3709971.1 hypothetical protein [Salinibacter ruber]MCS4170203.1 hypothetical protein [Salinibacter ruber]
MSEKQRTETENVSRSSGISTLDGTGVFRRPQFHILRHAEGHIWTETYDSIQKGRCKNCGREVVKIEGSSITNRTDGMRYAYPEDTEGWCIFRCGCGEVIHESWVAV